MVGESCIILNIAIEMVSLWVFLFLFLDAMFLLLLLFVLPLHLLKFGGTKHNLHVRL